MRSRHAPVRPSGPRRCYSLVPLSSSAAAPSALDQLIVPPNQTFTSLLLSVPVFGSNLVNLVASSPVITTCTAGEMDTGPAVNGTAADRSRWVKPLSAKLND